MTSMKHIVTTTVSVLAAVSLAACASTAPKELEEARATFDRVESGPAADQAPAELHEARTALKTAEKAFEDEGDEPVTRDRAYIATRRAQLADTVAQIRVQSQRIADAHQEKERLEQRLQRDTTRELSETRDALERQRQETQTERRARLQAEARAREAKDALEKYVDVNQDARGLVITLASGAMFATGSAELRSAAKEKIDRVADYLTEHPERSIVIEGHTDDRGSAVYNEQLSRERAQAVRDYLAVKGVPTDQMRVKAYGEERPVASNDTSEGRATNRRVEIVMEPIEGESAPRGEESMEDESMEPTEEETNE
ncbi:MAG: OmpA family protein [Myxococcota bacterium]